MANLFRNFTEHFRRNRTDNFIRNADSQPVDNEREEDDYYETTRRSIERIRESSAHIESQVDQFYREQIESVRRQAIYHEGNRFTLDTNGQLNENTIHQLIHGNNRPVILPNANEESQWLPFSRREENNLYRNRYLNMEQDRRMRQVLGNSIHETRFDESAHFSNFTMNHANTIGNTTYGYDFNADSERLVESDLSGEQFRIFKNDIILLTSYSRYDSTASVEDDFIVEFMTLRDGNLSSFSGEVTLWAYGKTVTAVDRMNYGSVIIFDLSSAKKLSTDNNQRIKQLEVAPANPKLPEI